MSIIDKAIEKRKQIEAMTAFVDNDNAPEFAEFFPLWSGDAKIYTVGMRVRYGGTVYQVTQPHTSQDDWNPQRANNLWVVVQPEPVGGGILSWVAGEAVKVGDKRIYNGDTYECIQGHTTAAHWTPPIVNTLWKKV